MTTGRKRIPDAIKIAAGTFRADRAVTGVPSLSAPLAKRPEPPESLQETGKNKWADVVAKFDTLQLLESRYLDAIEMYCRAWDRLTHYEEEYFGNEFTVVESGYICAHPAIALAKQARDEIRRYQVEFGFTPSSASSVKSTAPAKRGVPNRAKDVG